MDHHLAPAKPRATFGTAPSDRIRWRRACARRSQDYAGPEAQDRIQSALRSGYLDRRQGDSRLSPDRQRNPHWWEITCSHYL